MEKYSADNRAFELEVLRLINEQRALINLPLLTEHRALTQAARRHAEDMAAHQSSSHIGSDGSNPGDRVVQEGYSGLISGEALSIGSKTPAEIVLDGWMNSPAHRAILLDPNATEAGIGYAEGFACTPGERRSWAYLQKQKLAFIRATITQINLEFVNANGVSRLLTRT